MELNFEKICEKYPDRWLLIIVTAWDENSEPIGGKILAHSQYRTRINEATKIARELNDEIGLLTMFTGDESIEEALLREPPTENIPKEQSEETPPIETGEEQQSKERKSSSTVTNVADWGDVYSSKK